MSSPTYNQSRILQASHLLKRLRAYLTINELMTSGPKRSVFLRAA